MSVRPIPLGRTRTGRACIEQVISKEHPYFLAHRLDQIRTCFAHWHWSLQALKLREATLRLDVIVQLGAHLAVAVEEFDVPIRAGHGIRVLEVFNIVQFDAPIHWLPRHHLTTRPTITNSPTLEVEPWHRVLHHCLGEARHVHACIAFAHKVKWVRLQVWEDAREKGPVGLVVSGEDRCVAPGATRGGTASRPLLRAEGETHRGRAVNGADRLCLRPSQLIRPWRGDLRLRECLVVGIRVQKHWAPLLEQAEERAGAWAAVVPE
eukprot:CAMPEP_0180419592 /NCGR_PEP_ID=MMETSP1036_2-20121128/2181_1 /TAXON_ID=632150 /ORGANISM="Azadinium spinosum, Strain 3D9" /LENGTH=263 /DNA_ID=CAMNT_0022424763 /DNA_START=541 /DNA_END=1332 /DNA_ORIENTATION=-